MYILHVHRHGELTRVHRLRSGKRATKSGNCQWPLPKAVVNGNCAKGAIAKGTCQRHLPRAIATGGWKGQLSGALAANSCQRQLPWALTKGNCQGRLPRAIDMGQLPRATPKSNCQEQLPRAIAQGQLPKGPCHWQLPGAGGGGGWGGDAVVLRMVKPRTHGCHKLVIPVVTFLILLADNVAANAWLSQARYPCGK